MLALEIAAIVLIIIAVLFGTSARVVKQYERALVFRFGRIVGEVRGPGLAVIVPVIDRLRKVNMQIVTLPVPAQDGITRDNVTVNVDAVVYYRVIDPVAAMINVQDYPFAVLQVAQTSLRSVIGKSDLDDLLSNRERLNQGLEVMIDSPALGWGIHIDRVEIKDVALPESMKRSMSRQAEAERERRARVISAEGEYQASEKLSQAAAVMADTPGALQLRLLETIVQVASEKNSTLVLPFPVELLRFLEHNSTAPAPAAAAPPAVASTAATPPAVAAAATAPLIAPPAAAPPAAASPAAATPAAAPPAAAPPAAAAAATEPPALDARPAPTLPSQTGPTPPAAVPAGAVTAPVVAPVEPAFPNGRA